MSSRGSWPFDLPAGAGGYQASRSSVLRRIRRRRHAASPSRSGRSGAPGGTASQSELPRPVRQPPPGCWGPTSPRLQPSSTPAWSRSTSRRSSVPERPGRRTGIIRTANGETLANNYYLVAGRRCMASALQDYSLLRPWSSHGEAENRGAVEQAHAAHESRRMSGPRDAGAPVITNPLGRDPGGRAGYWRHYPANAPGGGPGRPPVLTTRALVIQGEHP